MAGEQGLTPRHPVFQMIYVCVATLASFQFIRREEAAFPKLAETHPFLGLRKRRGRKELQNSI